MYQSFTHYFAGTKYLACAFFCCLFFTSTLARQKPVDTNSFTVKILSGPQQPVQGATVQLLSGDKLVKAAISDKQGLAQFNGLAAGPYVFSVSSTGFITQKTGVVNIPGSITVLTLTLQPASIGLKEVGITSHRPPIEQKQGKVIVNVDASPSNVGTTVLEVLEKSPGVTVDRSGTISLQGKTGVLVLIDDKPTYLSGDDLNNLLSSMSSAQVDQIELMTNPPAKYDASGNAGVINIKTKKNKAKGFNGSVTASVGHGLYPKSADNISLNYRSGKFNTFFNYSINAVQYYLQLTALRKYYDSTGTLLSTLNQPAYFKGNFLNNTVKTGVDYYLSPKTTLGLVLTGTLISRDGDNLSTASWLEPTGTVDSAIATNNRNNNSFKNGAINLNVRHTISSTQNITADFDALHYNMGSTQAFDNQLLAPGGYDELTRANIPTSINITSGKVDYTLQADKNNTLQAGFKSSHSSTDNSALYENFDGTNYIYDDTRSNHFIYNENVSALYAELDGKGGKWGYQAGLRYEHTGYHAHQLGNAVQPDSAFSRDYGGFFPSGYLSYQADTANSFTLSAGRRIDRPAFQVLNPFLFIINKYTYQTGNAFILPQYSWNLTLSHQYKNLLTTSISYSVIENYFSQLFLADTTKGILLYSQGNVGHTYNLGISEMVTASPFNWWSFNVQGVFNHKQLAGFNGNDYTSLINQFTVNLSSQVIFAKNYTAEVTGAYTTHARNDIQELLYPTGQLSFGLSKPVLNHKGSIKISYRDVLHTNWMEGLTQFPNATEYFKELRDTRVLTIAFTYRFGQSYKADKHTDTSVDEEKDRVGNG